MEARLGGQVLLGNPGLLKMLAYATNAVDNHAAYKNTSQCGLQGLIHTRMGFFPFTHRRMERTPDEKRDILRKFIRDKGLKVARWAKAAGVNANSIYNFLNGHSDGLDGRTYGKLARAAEVPTWRLSGEEPDIGSPTAIWVAGYVEAGDFQVAVEWDRSEWYSVDVPLPARFRNKTKGLEVRGPSMNRRYPEGSIVMWVDMLDFREPRNKDRVIVYAYCRDDGIEATVKEYREEGGVQWLWPLSTHPDHQQPINPRNPPEHIKRIEIKGIVIGSYLPEVY